MFLAFQLQYCSYKYYGFNLGKHGPDHLSRSARGIYVVYKALDREFLFRRQSSRFWEIGQPERRKEILRKSLRKLTSLG